MNEKGLTKEDLKSLCDVHGGGCVAQILVWVEGEKKEVNTRLLGTEQVPPIQQQQQEQEDDKKV